MDDDLARLERAFQHDPSDLSLARRLFAQRERAGITHQDKPLSEWFRHAIADTDDAALDALRALGPLSAAPFAEALEQHGWALRQRAAQLLQNLPQLTPLLAPTLLELLGNHVSEVRQSCLYALLASRDDDPRIAARLTELLDHEEPARRAFATQALGLIPQGDAALSSIELLIRALDDEDLAVRGQAAEALGRLGEESVPAVPRLAEALKDPGWAVRVAAAEALGNIGPPARDGNPALIVALMTADWDVRRASARALAAIGEAEAAVDPLIKELGHEYLEHRLFALRSLAIIAPEHPQTGPALHSMAQDPAVIMRQSLAEILAERPPCPDSRDVLLRLLEDTDRDVRSQASLALARLGFAEAALPVALPWLEAEDRRDLAWAGYHVAGLTAACPDGPLRDRGIAELIAALEPARRFELRAQTAQGLTQFGQLPDELVGPVARALASDPTFATREAAASALRNAPGEVATRALIAAMRDRDVDVRRAATQAMIGRQDCQEQAFEGLLERLRGDSIEIRGAAADALAQLPGLGERVLAVFEEVFGTGPEYLREAILYAVRDLDLPAASRRAFLTARLTDPHRNVAETARHILDSLRAADDELRS